jgi:osmotically-inducible protein OsmY
MKPIRLLLVSMTVMTSVLVMQGCAVTRGQSTVGEYIDDATVTTRIKTHFVEAKAVDATAIRVETLNGNVILSGFAKTADERTQAEALARAVNGVKSVKNAIEVRP